MALTNYTLPLIDREFGTYRLTLQVENAVIVGAEDQVVLSLGSISESVDDIAGLVEVSNLTVTFIEEYSNYSIGWWLSVVEDLGPYTDDIRLKVELDEGAGYNIIFWGVINRQNVRYESAYVSSATGSSTAYTTKRIVYVEFLDLITLLQTTTMASVAVEANTHAAQYSYQPDPTLTGNIGNQIFLKVTDIIAGMAKEAFGQTYASTDCVVVNDDIRFLHDVLGAARTLGDIYVIVNQGGIGYFASNQTDDYVGNTYRSAYDYLSMLCTNFAVIARRKYSGGRHTIELSTRGRAYSDYLTFSRPPTADEVRLTNAAKATAIRMTFLDNVTTLQSWTQGDGVRSNIEPTPAKSEFDMEFKPDFFQYNAQLADIWRAIYAVDNDTVMRAVRWTYIYNYSSGAFEIATRLDDGWVAYFFYRFDEWRMISRTYHTLSATKAGATSYDNLSVLNRIQDNDGSGSLSYFISSVTKDLDNGISDLGLVAE